MYGSTSCTALGVGNMWKERGWGVWDMAFIRDVWLFQRKGRREKLIETVTASDKWENIATSAVHYGDSWSKIPLTCNKCEWVHLLELARLLVVDCKRVRGRKLHTLSAVASCVCGVCQNVKRKPQILAILNKLHLSSALKAPPSTSAYVRPTYVCTNIYICAWLG